MTAPSHVVEDQSEAIAFLADPRSHGGAAVERIDTHGAVVVLAGERAYKLKRAVRFPYMDFSTLDLRRRACEAELRLNRRTAPSLYLGIAPIARTESGGLAIGGSGPIVDWLVVMRRFPDDANFARMAAAGALDEELVRDLVDAILRFHAAAERRPDHGGAGGIAWVVAGNDEGLKEAGAAVFPRERVAALRRRCDAALARHAALLEARRARGLVRHCHGDLHLRNICLFEGKPTLFDAIEFNERIACIDVLYDLAFLLADFDRVDLRPFANLALNRYLAEGARDGGDLGDLDGLAAVRAQVSAAAAASQPSEAAAARELAAARRSLGQALAYLAPSPPRLVAIGGVSGTGKSTLARALAPHLGAAPGAVLLRSDVIRKHLAGRDAEERLTPAHYTAEWTARVYAALCARSRAALAAGRAVIVDAVYARPEERAAIEGVARDLGAPFDGLWLEARGEALGARIAARVGDASDATVAVLRRQLDLPLGALRWRRLDASLAPDAVAARALAMLKGGEAGD